MTNDEEMLEKEGFEIISQENEGPEFIGDLDEYDKNIERQGIVDRILRVFGDEFIDHVDTAAYNILFWAHKPEDPPAKADMSTRVEALRSAMGMSDMAGELHIRTLETEDEVYVLGELNRVYCLQKLLNMGVIEADNPEIEDSDDIVYRWQHYDYTGDVNIESYIDGDSEFDVVPQ